MGSLPTVITNFFQDPRRSRIWKHFHPYFFCTRFILFLEASTRFTMTKISKTQVPSFHAYVDIKQCLHISKVHLEIKTSMIERQTKTAPSWSFILMLLMTTDQFSEFDRICVDQGLDLVFEGHAIFHGMPSNSSVILTSGINIVSFWIWRSLWSCADDRNPIVLNQYKEQFFIGHRKCVVHFGPFLFLSDRKSVV